MAPLYFHKMEIIVPNPFTVRPPVVIMYFITGWSFSPSSTRISLKLFFALSNPA